MNPKWTEEWAEEERTKWPYGEPQRLPNVSIPVLQRAPIYPSGVFVEIIDGRPVVSIRCSDNGDLDELTALARRILAAIG